jgi:hypothetical protein
VSLKSEARRSPGSNFEWSSFGRVISLDSTFNLANKSKLNKYSATLLWSSAEHFTGGSKLLGIPVEFQNNVVEYVRIWMYRTWAFWTRLTISQLATNEGKKSVCLVCKQLQVVATPYLYRNMEINWVFLSKRYVSQPAKAHLGLSSVRILRIVGPYIMRYGTRYGALIDEVCQLLSVFSKNSLTRFE